MEIKSSEEIANETARRLQYKCTHIGKRNVDAPRNAYIAGLPVAIEAFERINGFHLSYKECLDSDALTIKSIGVAIAEADSDLTKTYQ